MTVPVNTSTNITDLSNGNSAGTRLGQTTTDLVSFYGNGQAHDIGEPAPTVTCKDRFGLVRPIIEIDGNQYLLDIRFRMLQPHELALAQGFPRGYQFTGTKTDQVKQIGNAVPRRLARAIVGAVLSQNPDVSALVGAEEDRDEIERGAA